MWPEQAALRTCRQAVDAEAEELMERMEELGARLAAAFQGRQHRRRQRPRRSVAQLPLCERGGGGAGYIRS